MIDPQRGEVWWVSLDPTRGDEIQKTRPCVVLTLPGYGRAGLRLTVPVVGWQPHFAAWPWMIELAPDAHTGLIKPSGADASQIRAASLSRFQARLGVLPGSDLDSITGAVALCIGHAMPLTASVSPPASSP